MLLCCVATTALLPAAVVHGELWRLLEPRRLPLLLTTFGYYHLQATSLTAQLTLCWLYHVIRMGPMFMNFAYVYSLCHKEGHAAAAGRGAAHRSSRISNDRGRSWLCMIAPLHVSRHTFFAFACVHCGSCQSTYVVAENSI